MAYERITVDPNRMRGLPCIRDTRVTVSAVLGRGPLPRLDLADHVVRDGGPGGQEAFDAAVAAMLDRPQSAVRGDPEADTRP